MGFPDPATSKGHGQPPVSSWARQLEGGDIALAFFNLHFRSNDVPSSSDEGSARSARDSYRDACQWNRTVDSYADGPNTMCKVFPNASAAQDACCTDPLCKSVSYTPQTSVHRPGFGCLKSALKGTRWGADGYRKVNPGPGPSPPPSPPPSPAPPSPPPSPPQPGNATISVCLSGLGFAVHPAATFTVLDIWAGTRRVGLVRGSGTVDAKDVPIGGTTFLRLTQTNGEREGKGV